MTIQLHTSVYAQPVQAKQDFLFSAGVVHAGCVNLDAEVRRSQETQAELLLQAAGLQEAAASADFKPPGSDRLSQMETRLDVLLCRLHEEEERRVRDVEEKQDEIQRLLLMQPSHTAVGETTSPTRTHRRLALAHERLLRCARRDALRDVWQWLVTWVGVRRQLKSNLSYAELRDRQRKLLQTWQGTMEASR